MEHYISGNTIKKLREKNHITQKNLAEQLNISDKTISKWETNRGLPDVAMIEPLAKALGISVTELLTGEYVTNSNISSNMLRSKFYVCPICGNVIHTMGEGVIQCCGITLPVLEVEETRELHEIKVEQIEHEFYVTMDHEMTKNHYISWIAYTTSNRIELIKLYAEGNAEARFIRKGHGIIYAYCNRDGLFKVKI